MTMLEILQASPPFAIGAALILGLFIGSFLNVVIYRLPVMMEHDWRKQCAELASEETNTDPKQHSAQNAQEKAFNLVTPRSRCPKCNTPIRAWQNIPLLSWMLLRGRCASCKANISVRYPLVELATGLLSAAVVWRFGVDWTAAAALLLTWCLVALTMIDIDHQLLPDAITLPLLWAGLLFSLHYTATGPLALPTDLRSSVIGAASGYLSLWSIFHLFRLLTGKEGMGYGDFKLFAVFGAWFGWQMLPLIILLSAFTGAVVGIALIVLRRHGREVPIPFGPYLAAAGWIALMWGPQLVDRYLHMAGMRGGL